MILVADSGATGTDWALIGKNMPTLVFKTKGLNVNYLSESEIHDSIIQDVIPPLLPYHREVIEEIRFFGSGCSNPIKQNMMGRQLGLISKNAAVFPDHDMLGAAISLCGDDMGLVSILGTGSNTCFYDGKNVKKNILSLGYLLGDEGSGTYMGMHLIKNYLKGYFPSDLEQAFVEKYPRKKYEIVGEMYAAPKAGAYFAAYTYFMVEHKDHPYISELVQQCFDRFMTEQVMQFEPECHQYPLGAVGSIAYLFKNELNMVALKHNVTLGNVLKNPIEGLIKYYQQQYE